MDVKRTKLTDGWVMQQAGGEERFETRVPNSVFETLLEHNKIDDPFYGTNEKQMDWVYESDWVFTRRFGKACHFEQYEYVTIRFNGLDTVAEVFLNGEPLHFSDNMHRTYEIYLKTPGFNRLNANDNELKIVLKSPTKEARERLARMGFTPDDERIQSPFSIPGVETLRKAYYAFGWDWGPILPDIGIWRDVELTLFNRKKIEDLYVTSEIDYSDSADPLPTAEKAKLNCELAVTDLGLKDALSAGVSIYDGTKQIAEKEVQLPEAMSWFTLEIENPKLWWTNEFGEPHLYRIVVELKDGNKSLDTLEKRIGIREIELKREADQWGESFYFELNTVPVFAKGGNWIPTDSFIPRGRRNKLHEKVLSDCVAANMNMIRVWGGGIYEDDAFYDFCDENGLLVWQDFAFACKPTPDFKGFEESIRKEAVENIRRLRNHPSLAIWVGNNEIEEGWVSWGFRDFVPKLETFYIRLFEELLPELVAEYDEKRPYWPSSPSGGGGFKDTQSAEKGDSHYWKVWHEGYPLESYRAFDSRFMSEFGFESFPSMKTLESFCPRDQMTMYSEIMESHQKNPAGNQKIMDYMAKRFRVPEDFSKQVILSQITQAEAMEYGVEHWRRNRNGQHCMGALYWQINDCWPVASWSSIDYYGRWKALQYYAKRFYNPVFISGEEDEERIDIWVTNDRAEKIEGKVTIKIETLNGDVLMKNSEKVEIDRLGSQRIKRIALSELPVTAKEAIAFFELTTPDGKEQLSYGFRAFRAPKELELKDPGLTWKLAKSGKDTYTITLRAERPALYCFVEVEGADVILSDNFFSLESGREKRITFQYKEKLDKAGISVRSLFDLI